MTFVIDLEQFFETNPRRSRSSFYYFIADNLLRKSLKVITLKCTL